MNKIPFYLIAGKTQGETLSELALMLARRLRKAGVSVLLLPDVVKKSLESQYARLVLRFVCLYRTEYTL